MVLDLLAQLQRPGLICPLEAHVHCTREPRVPN